MKILLIDDDHAIAELWSLGLRKAGHEVVAVFTGKEGLEKVQAAPPDVILLDQILPDMKGNDVLRILKDNPQTQAIPVLILSNYSDPSMMKDAVTGGANEYILKYQITPEELANKVNTAVTLNS